ncbi:unnamed protein product [Parascedosporium putredinis]|uniref:Uncharacterized protein n=1 Tax=Parascedosporium putredinis TaxID=1442378 RepID=A0A9P1GYK2_9PEZI|nr:unnamed protein product [Parascedosporium putredinis]CAI7990835.1 unnamed protein product [Parascedosporium putredinis]
MAASRSLPAPGPAWVEHALLLGKRGATVVVNDLIAATAEAVAKAIVDAGGNAIAVPGSVAERSVTDAIVQTTIDKFNRIDILVNNAGIDIAGEFPDVSPEQFSQMLGVHVHGSWNLAQAVWPHMVKQKYGRILIVSSAALYGMPQNSAYTVAKGALFGLSKALSFDGEPHGILVNALGPIANTGMTTEIVTEGPIFDLIEQNYPASAVSPWWRG